MTTKTKDSIKEVHTGEEYLLREMVKCKEEIRQLQAEILLLEDKYAYLKGLYYQQGESDKEPAGLRDLDERIRTDGFVIGIRF